jgi:hypothetical protein
MEWQAKSMPGPKPDLDTQAKQPVSAKFEGLDRWLNSVRERIEGVFHELTNTGRDLEGLLAKTLVGLCTRVIAKMASHALKHVLNIQFGIKVQTFEMTASAA